MLIRRAVRAIVGFFLALGALIWLVGRNIVIMCGYVQDD